MKSGYEILKEMPKAFYTLSIVEMAEFIEEFRKEVYNQAIEDVLLEQVYIGDCTGVFTEKIIKLKIK